MWCYPSFLGKAMVWLRDERERVGTLFLSPHKILFSPQAIYMPYFCVRAAHRRAIRILLSQTVTLYTYSNAYIYAICFIYFSLGVAKKNKASYKEIRNAMCTWIRRTLVYGAYVDVCPMLVLSSWCLRQIRVFARSSSYFFAATFRGCPFRISEQGELFLKPFW